MGFFSVRAARLPDRARAPAPAAATLRSSRRSAWTGVGRAFMGDSGSEVEGRSLAIARGACAGGRELVRSPRKYGRRGLLRRRIHGGEGPVILGDRSVRARRAAEPDARSP